MGEHPPPERDELGDGGGREHQNRDGQVIDAGPLMNGDKGGHFRHSQRDKNQQEPQHLPTGRSAGSVDEAAEPEEGDEEQHHQGDGESQVGRQPKHFVTGDCDRKIEGESKAPELDEAPCCAEDCARVMVGGAIGLDCGARMPSLRAVPPAFPGFANS